MSVDTDAVLDWYAAQRRDLPWRRTRDPYRILVSEVMLQQTQVARVVPYYEAFLARFPTAGALAEAPAADVLAHWSGLGYNRRALALQAASAVVAREGWPADAEGLQTLPGIGPYTAAAVAAFAFDEQVAAVDTNVRRVVERIDRRAYRPGELAERAGELLPPGRAADWNQAMMELGATVCSSRTPTCDACPVEPCGSRGLPPAERDVRGAASAKPRRVRTRFEDTDRYVRGRIVAALVSGCRGDELVAGRALPEGIEAVRVERALAGLVRDGLVVSDGAAVRLPLGGFAAGRARYAWVPLPPPSPEVRPRGPRPSEHREEGLPHRASRIRPRGGRHASARGRRRGRLDQALGTPAQRDGRLDRQRAGSCRDRRGGGQLIRDHAPGRGGGARDP